jgi:4-amino-4-deoxy-L-arabinose transferase-like glycosyltransferase
VCNTTHDEYVGRLAVGLLPYLSGVRLSGTGTSWEQGRRLLEEAGDYWTTLTLARAGTLLFVPLLLYPLYRWSAALYGREAGLAAVILASFCPNLLAHASLATNDFAAAATMIAAAYGFWRWLEEPSLRAAVLAAAAAGLALAAKFSALVYLPPVFLLCLLVGPRPAAPARSLLAQAAVFFGVVYAVLGATYGFRWLPVAYLEGAVGVWRHAQRGHPGFLMGEWRQHGWWYYFPVALGLKSTVPMLALAMGAVCLLGARRQWRLAGPAAGAAAILAAAMSSSVNIGVRHVLPLFPFLAVVGSAAVAQGGRRWVRALAILALLWHAGESLAAHPDYLAYFNQLARGREQELLGDSNLDWGQDLARLARYLERHRIEQIHLNYFGTTSPAALGIRHVTEFGPADRPRGWVAISLGRLQAGGADYAWLGAHQPYARIGKSILLYHVPASDF